MTKRLISIFLLFITLPACVQTELPIAPVSTNTASAITRTVTWWQNAVFYEIFVRSFYDTDGDGIGDFNGIRQKLDYLQALGVNALWLMPIHPSPSYHGYDVVDFYDVNPEYGTMEDFKILVAAAHKRDIRIILDLVLNHTSRQHPFFLEANNDPNSAYRDWYIWSSSPGNHWHQGSDGYYYGFFWEGMPDLNYLNPAVTSEMLGVTRYWLEDIGVDGFRVDAAKHLIEEDGKVENTRATHEWYEGFYEDYKSIDADAYTVGEAFGGGAFVAKTYENQFDQIFNFEFASGFVSGVRAGTNTPINSAIRFALSDKPDFNFAIFLTNHDQDRIMSVLDGDTEKAKVAGFLLLTSPGTPFIYYGEEIGMQGRKPDEDIRLPMQWSSDVNAGFTTGIPWRAPDTSLSEVNAATQEDDPDSLLSLYRNLISLRNQHSALQTGELILVETGNPAIYTSLRMDEYQTLLVLVNLSDQAVSDYGLTLEDGTLPDGTYEAESLFGDGQVEGPLVNGGAFNEYKPLDVIAPFTKLIIKINR